MFDPPNELLGVCTRRVLCLKGVFLVDDVLWSVFIFNTFPKVLFFLPVLFFLLVFVVFFMGIAGFCGETEMEHEDILSLLKLVRYNYAFLFAYSMRKVSAVTYILFHYLSKPFFNS